MKSHRDYRSEAAAIKQLIRRWYPEAETLLEVACGTGSLLQELHQFQRTGLDLSSHMLGVARRKLGDSVNLVQGDLTDFNLERLFDVVLCMDGAIGYVANESLENALACLARHLTSGGLLIVEPWYSPEEWTPQKIHVVHHKTDEATVIRVGYGYLDGAIDFHNVIGTAEGIQYFDEHYVFTLHSDEHLLAVLGDVGLIDVCKETAPRFQRGLFIGHRISH